MLFVNGKTVLKNAKDGFFLELSLSGICAFDELGV